MYVQVVIVDDNPNMFHAQPENALWVKPYDGSPEDSALQLVQGALLGQVCN